MSISTTYNIVSKNETFSLNWPTSTVVNPSLECPIIGILTSYTEINLFDEEGNVTGVSTVKTEEPVRCHPEDFEPELCEVFLYSCSGAHDLSSGITTTTEYWAVHPAYTIDNISTTFFVPDENSVDRYDGDLAQLALMSEAEWCNLKFENDASLQTGIGTNYTFLILEQNELLRAKYLSTSTSPNNTFLVDQLGLKALSTSEHDTLVAIQDGPDESIAGVGMATSAMDNPDDHSIPTTP
tara:strand:+ start:1762 stop:2478 length:717 start_codon:yes stop_codon:yes gene_type:complete